MNTPFLDRMAAIARRGPRFFVPGHKGSPAAIPFMGTALRYDLTEVEGACDLSAPDGPLAESEANMAWAYGSGATLYSAAGSTSCVQAMLALFVGAGGRAVMARGCHVAAVRALALLDIAPTWVPLADGRPSPDDIDAALKQSGAGAVYLTSPDYYGRMPDIAAIAAVCRRHGAALLVDNAQGAHLRFFAVDGGATPDTASSGPPPGALEGLSPRQAPPRSAGAEPGASPQNATHSALSQPSAIAPSRHPLHLGADATADSAHKALPCLTPAALLHLRDGALRDAARQALNLFSSTSPSYLVLQSLDYAAGLLLDEAARPDFAGAARRLQRAADAFPALAAPCDDPLRLVLCPRCAGLPYNEAHAALLAAGIAPEYADGSHMVLMASPWNTEADFAALEQALAGLRQAQGRAATPTPAPCAGAEGGPPDGPEPPAASHSPALGRLPAAIPPARCSVRQALFGAKTRLPASQAAGRVLAGLHAPCPPGVPIALPGELLTPEIAAAMIAGGISEVDVLL